MQEVNCVNNEMMMGMKDQVHQYRPVGIPFNIFNIQCIIHFVGTCIFGIRYLKKN